MSAINLHNAKTHLSRLVEAAASGQEVVIAKHGRPVARLVPVGHRRDLAALTAEMRAFRDGVGEPLPVRELIDEGRRY